MEKAPELSRSDTSVADAMCWQHKHGGVQYASHCSVQAARRARLGRTEAVSESDWGTRTWTMMKQTSSSAIIMAQGPLYDEKHIDLKKA